MKVVPQLVRLTYELATAAIVLPLIEFHLRRATLPVTCRRMRVRLDLDGVAPRSGPHPPLPGWTRSRIRVAHLVTSHWPAGDTCLRRCLVTGYLLRRLDPVLRIGVGRDRSGAVAAHSWLEIDGRPLDVDLDGFFVLGRPAS